VLEEELADGVELLEEVVVELLEEVVVELVVDDVVVELLLEVVLAELLVVASGTSASVMETKLAPLPAIATYVAGPSTMSRRVATSGRAPVAVTFQRKCTSFSSTWP
jgi:hypothetical protein